MRRHLALMTACLTLLSACGDAAVSSDDVTVSSDGASSTPEDAAATPTDAASPEDAAPIEPVVTTAPVEAYGLRVIDVEVDPALLQAMHDNYDDDITATVVVTMDGLRREGVEFELHGGHVRTLPKKTYRLVFPDEEKPTVDWFGDGLETQRRVVVQANWIDPTSVRNKLTFDLIRDAGGLAPRVGYCILSLNGSWHGLYSLIERIDKPYLDRQDLDKDGNLYKAENHLANWNHKADPLDGFDVEINEDNPTDDLDDLLAALTYTPQTQADFVSEVEPRLNLEDFDTWQRVQVFALNRDTFTKNYYLYHDLDEDLGDPKGRFRVISWDADATFGLNWNGEWLDTDEVSWHGTDAFSQRLYEIPEYKAAYKAAFQSALDGSLSPTSIATRIASTTSRIRSAAIADLIHWERSDLDFDAAVQTLKDAVQARHDVMTTVTSNL
jgi:spore coat protein H